MVIQNDLETLSQEDADQVRQILSEPHLEEGTIRRIDNQRKYQVINYLMAVMKGDGELNKILTRISVDEELRRIRNGYECANDLPKNYLKAIEDAFGKWGIISFYRGRWEIKNPGLSEILPEISMKHIYTGSKKLEKAFKKNPVEEKLNFLLELQWRRIDNSYQKMFGGGIFQNYYAAEKWADENGSFARA